MSDLDTDLDFNVRVDEHEEEWNDYYLESEDGNWQLHLGGSINAKELGLELALAVEEHKEPFPEVYEDSEGPAGIDPELTSASYGGPGEHVVTLATEEGEQVSAALTLEEAKAFKEVLDRSWPCWV